MTSGPKFSYTWLFGLPDNYSLSGLRAARQNFVRFFGDSNAYVIPVNTAQGDAHARTIIGWVERGRLVNEDINSVLSCVSGFGSVEDFVFTRFAAGPIPLFVDQRGKPCGYIYEYIKWQNEMPTRRKEDRADGEQNTLRHWRRLVRAPWGWVGERRREP